MIQVTVIVVVGKKRTCTNVKMLTMQCDFIRELLNPKLVLENR